MYVVLVSLSSVVDVVVAQKEDAAAVICMVVKTVVLLAMSVSAGHSRTAKCNVFEESGGVWSKTQVRGIALKFKGNCKPPKAISSYANGDQDAAKQTPAVPDKNLA